MSHKSRLHRLLNLPPFLRPEVFPYASVDIVRDPASPTHGDPDGSPRTDHAPSDLGASVQKVPDSGHLLGFPQAEPEPTVHPVTARAFRDLHASAKDVREAIREASTVKEAYALYQLVQAMARVLTELTDEAGKRCEEILERL